MPRQGAKHVHGIALVLLALCGQASAHPLDAAAGKALFERNWIPAPASTAASDGLGPFYNARSCAACHPDGGQGDAPQALTLGLDDPVYGRQLQTLALPGLAPEGALTWRYVPDARGRRLDITLSGLRYGPLDRGYSPRLAPSLSGIGALARIDEAAILALADAEDRDGDGISGRAHRLPDGRIGRFGHKADMPTLAGQVARAFSLDLGMGSDAFPSSHGDCTAQQADCLAGVPGEVTGATPRELGPEPIDLILAYLDTLEAPAGDADPQGLALFRDTGCAACHVPELPASSGKVSAYTDLLLHDMGPELADSLDQGLAREWRTAPLWGLARRASLLHDGRARDPHEAILWHEGEGTAAREAYLALDDRQRARLLAFLSSL